MLLTIFVVRSKNRPAHWFIKCLDSLVHDQITIQVIEGVPTLPELLKLRLTLPYLCKTKYMAFVDDDDWIDSKHITPMLDILENGDWGGIYSDETYVSEEGRIIGHRDSFMKVFDPSMHYMRLIDTHHLTIVRTDLAIKAVDQIPKDDIYLEPLIYGLVGLQKPLVHYPHRTYFWRFMDDSPSRVKIVTQNLGTKNASIFYKSKIKEL